MSNLLNNFLRGLLLLVPMAAAIYVVVYLYNFLDNLIPVVKNIPGLSFVLVVLFITMVGSFARRYNTGMINWFENIIKDIPLLNLVYSSIKDLMTSFMGEKKKFNKPVLVKVESSLYKPGFVTMYWYPFRESKTSLIVMRFLQKGLLDFHKLKNGKIISFYLGLILVGARRELRHLRFLSLVFSN